jgi:hypothetical protein
MVDVIAKRPFFGLEGAVKRGARLTVDDARLKELGRLVEVVGDASGQPAAPKVPPGPAADDQAAKAEPAPENKMAPTPENKAEAAAPARRGRPRKAE